MTREPQRRTTPQTPTIDEFLLAAGGIEKVTVEPRRPQHPGWTRRELESIVSGGALKDFAIIRDAEETRTSWRGVLVLLILALLSWCALVGALWTGTRLWHVAKVWF